MGRRRKVPSKRFVLQVVFLCSTNFYYICSINFSCSTWVYANGGEVVGGVVASGNVEI